ncbi:MAG: hypothetical protein Q8908_12450, partial [Bacteroidota bacterium]|nr:hypothetical protein [Bacteroidota bacterium]
MHKNITMSFVMSRRFLVCMFFSLLFSSLASAQVTQLGDQALKPKPQKTIDKDSLKVVYFFDKVDSLNT